MKYTKYTVYRLCTSTSSVARTHQSTVARDSKYGMVGGFNDNFTPKGASGPPPPSPSPITRQRLEGKCTLPVTKYSEIKNKTLEKAEVRHSSKKNAYLQSESHL